MHRGVCHPSGTGTGRAILGMPLDAALKPARAIPAVDHAFMGGIVAGCTEGSLTDLIRWLGWSGRGWPAGSPGVIRHRLWRSNERCAFCCVNHVSFWRIFGAIGIN